MTRPDSLAKQFLAELKRRRIPVVAHKTDDCYVINVLGVECTVSLDNIRRNAKRDTNPDAISGFIDSLLATRIEVPPWPEAAKGIRYSAEPSNHHFGDTLVESVTPAMSRVLAFTDAGESRVSWLSQAHLDRWGVSRRELEWHAATNMDGLLGATQLELQSVAGSDLGMFSTHSIFKASLIFSPGLKSFVASLGWPLLVVAPCRDFLYAFTDKALISRLGKVVVREFNESGYPVTQEVLQVFSSGVTALGSFGA